MKKSKIINPSFLVTIFDILLSNKLSFIKKNNNVLIKITIGISFFIVLFLTITGLIKANVPSRIAFAVSSQVDSRTILDQVGAEKLLGKGDMLYFPSGASKPTRVQGAFVSDEEVEQIVNFVKSNGTAVYSEDILDTIENGGKEEQIKNLSAEQAAEDDTDPFLQDAIDTVVETGQASTSFRQRKFIVGYARAGRIIDQMEERGVISGYQGSKPREVLWTLEKLAEMKMGSKVEE